MSVEIYQKPFKSGFISLKQAVNERQAHTFRFNLNSFFHSEPISTGCDTALWMRTNVISSRPDTTLNVLNYSKNEGYGILKSQPDSNSASCFFDSRRRREAWWFRACVMFAVQNIIIQWTFCIFCNSFSSRRDFVTRKWIPTCADLREYRFRAHQIENWSDFGYCTCSAPPFPNSPAICNLSSFFVLLARKMVFGCGSTLGYRIATVNTHYEEKTVTLSNMARSEILLIRNWMYFLATTTEKWLPIENDYTRAACASMTLNIQMPQRKIEKRRFDETSIKFEYSGFFRGWKICPELLSVVGLWMQIQSIFFFCSSHEHNPLWIPLVMSGWHFLWNSCLVIVLPNDRVVWKNMK